MSDEFKIESAALTHLGRKRRNNEDFVAFYEPDQPHELSESGRLYIVADGVGGAAKGEKASQYATQKVLYEFYNDNDPDLGERLRYAMRGAGNDVYKHIGKSGVPVKMATTMVAAAIRKGLLTVANVGDSRAYLIRDGRVKQITRDHTIAGEMLRDGEITEDEAQRIKGKNRLTRSLGGERDVHVDLFRDIPLQSGDRILLCSDGLTRYTSKDDIAVLTTGDNPKESVQQSIDLANKRGGADNVTALIIQIGQQELDAMPTIRRRGTQPTPVDWDEMVTQPSMQSPVRQNRRSRSPTNRVLLGIVGVILITLVGYALLRIARAVIPSSSPTPTVEQEALVSGLEPPLETQVDSAADSEGPSAPVPTVTAINPLAMIIATETDYKNLLDQPERWEPVTNIEITEGRMRASDPSTDQEVWWSFVRHLPIENLYVEVNVSFDGCSGKDAVGMVVRFDPNLSIENGYGLEFSCDGSYRILKYMNIEPDEILINWNPSDAIHTSEEAVNTMGFMAFGEKLCVYVDHQKIGQTEESTYKSGTIGLYANAAETAGLTVDFDQLSLWRISDINENQECPSQLLTEPLG